MSPGGRMASRQFRPIGRINGTATLSLGRSGWRPRPASPARAASPPAAKPQLVAAGGLKPWGPKVSNFLPHAARTVPQKDVPLRFEIVKENAVYPFFGLPPGQGFLTSRYFCFAAPTNNFQRSPGVGALRTEKSIIRRTSLHSYSPSIAPRTA